MNIEKYITQNSPVIIEAGTGNGEDIMEYSRLYPDGKLYAFEPNLNNIKLYRKIYLYIIGKMLSFMQMP